MPSFSDLKKAFSAQREAKKVQKELSSIHVEAEASGVIVTVSGGMEVVSIVIGDSVPRERIGALTMDALNRAMKKAQVVSAEKMQGVMSSLGLNFGGQ
jgi:DNA-binding protein YbaB